MTAYDETFDSTEVVRAVFYDAGYVISWVPAGDDKVTLWNYLDGAFDQLGDPMEDTEETCPGRPRRPAARQGDDAGADGPADPGRARPGVDLRDLRPGLLGGEPQLAVYVSNDDGDSGYLQADLDGTILQTSKAG